MEDGSFSKIGSRLSAAHIRQSHLQGLHGFAWSKYQKSRFGRIQDYQGAKMMFARGVEVARMAFWHGSGPSKRSSQVDPWRWNPENNVLACFRVFKRLPPNEAVPSMEEPL
eukprot:7267747-Pyramimonas_sp.AAC.1